MDPLDRALLTETASSRAVRMELAPSGSQRGE